MTLATTMPRHLGLARAPRRGGNSAARQPAGRALEPVQKAKAGRHRPALFRRRSAGFPSCTPQMW